MARVLSFAAAPVPVEPSQASRPPRLHVISFNGTWAGGVLSSRRTIVSEFVKLISDHENVFETPLDGVGSGISLVDKTIGGICGWSTLRNVITAHRNLSNVFDMRAGQTSERDT